MAALTLGQMRHRVRRTLRDSDEKFITPAEIDDLLNEAQLEIATRTLALQHETTGTLSVYQLALPSDYISIVTFRFGTDTVEWVDNEVFNSWKDDSAVPGHTLGRIFDNNFEFYPTPAASTAYTYRYAKTPIILDNDADTPEIPHQYHNNMVRYAQAHCKMKDGEPDEFQAYLTMYDAGLPPTKGPTINHRPGPMTIRFNPGPFDTNDAAHL